MDIHVYVMYGHTCICHVRTYMYMSCIVRGIHEKFETHSLLPACVAQMVTVFDYRAVGLCPPEDILFYVLLIN